MKVRKPKKCARCGTPMPSGSIAHLYRGGYWHAHCIRQYEKARAALVGAADTGK